MPNCQYLIYYILIDAMENQVLEYPSAFLKKTGIALQSLSPDYTLNQCIFKGRTNMTAPVPSSILMLKYYRYQ